MSCLVSKSLALHNGNIIYRTRVRSLATFVSDLLTHRDLIDVTLACEDATSKLVEVVTVADVSDEDRVADLEAEVW